MNHKKYGLLENGTIEPLYYDFKDEDGNPINEQRMIEEENGEYFLLHDVWMAGGIAFCCHKIIKEADTIEELKKWLIEI